MNLPFEIKDARIRTEDGERSAMIVVEEIDVIIGNAGFPHVTAIATEIETGDALVATLSTRSSIYLAVWYTK